MVSRFSTDIDSSEADARRPDETVYDVDIAELSERSQLSGFSQKSRDTAQSELHPDNNASVIQMAFIQLMTRKVMEATANCPEALKQMNSRIRSDKK